MVQSVSWYIIASTHFKPYQTPYRSVQSPHTTTKPNEAQTDIPSIPGSVAADRVQSVIDEATEATCDGERRKLEG